jgi:hypothetical protein
MAWSKSESSGAKRKERDAHLRSILSRSSLSDLQKPTKGPRINCSARKFGLEHRRLGKSDWQRYWAKYETAKQRDQALDVLNRKSQSDQFRSVDL